MGAHRRPAPPAPSLLGDAPTDGRHRAPRPTVAGRVAAAAPSLPAAGPLLGGAITLGVASTLVAPGAAVAAGRPGPSGTAAPVAQPRAQGLVVAVPGGARFDAPRDSELAALRGCESTGNYSIATGNGFYGAYQFDLSTWRSLGLGGYPQQAVPALQDAAASALEQSRGWQPWPACSAHLGLVPRRAGAGDLTAGGASPVSTPAGRAPVSKAPVSTAPSSRAPVSKAPASRARPGTAAASRPTRRASAGNGPTLVTPVRVPAATGVAPAFAGHVLTTADVGTQRRDVAQWQARMVQRGWRLAVDGRFGPQSSAVARSFAAHKGLTQGLPGEVGPQVWAAAWTLPVV